MHSVTSLLQTHQAPRTYLNPNTSHANRQQDNQNRTNQSSPTTHTQLTKRKTGKLRERNQYQTHAIASNRNELQPLSKKHHKIPKSKNQKTKNNIKHNGNYESMSVFDRNSIHIRALTKKKLADVRTPNRHARFGPACINSQLVMFVVFTTGSRHQQIKHPQKGCMTT